MLGTVALLSVLMLLYEADAVWDDPETYERVHNLSPEQYAVRCYRGAALFALPLVVSILTFVDRKRLRFWRALVYVGLLVLVMQFAYGCWEWAATGFDH